MKLFISVEGRHDISFLCAISSILKREGEEVPDLAKEEAAGRLVFIPLGGSNLSLWISRLAALNRPEFYFIDRDLEPPAPAKYADQAAEWIARGCKVWITDSREMENYLDPEILRAAQANYIGTGAAFEDVPLLFAKAVHEASPGASLWTTLSTDKVDEKVGRAKKRLNAQIALGMSGARLSRMDTGNQIREFLKQIDLALNVN